MTLARGNHHQRDQPPVELFARHRWLLSCPIGRILTHRDRIPYGSVGRLDPREGDNPCVSVAYLEFMAQRRSPSGPSRFPGARIRVSLLGTALLALGCSKAPPRFCATTLRIKRYPFDWIHPRLVNP